MRIINKIGDVFEVKITENTKKYFQYIATDMTMLNSSVIRAFKKTYAIIDNPNVESIINDEVDFYVHVVLRWGIQMGFWQKIGKNMNIGTIENILFRRCKDYGVKQGEEPIRISHQWCVWRINDDTFTYVGELEGENRKAEIGIVIDAPSIVHRMKTGEYDGAYPGFA